MPFKQAFGAAALPVAGVSAVAVAAAIGYLVYTGAPSGSNDPAPQAVSNAEADVVVEAAPARASLGASQTETAVVEPSQAAAPVVGEAQAAKPVDIEDDPVEKAAMSAPEPVATDAPAATDTTDGTMVAPEPAQTAQEADPEQESKAPISAEPKLSAPSVDIVRIPPTGISTVAGRADPDADILIFVDGIEVARARAGAGGEYVALFDIPAVERPREMQIAAQKDDTRVFAGSSIVIAPFLAAPVSDPVTPAPDLAIAMSDPKKAARENNAAESAPEGADLPVETNLPAEDAVVAQSEAPDAANLAPTDAAGQGIEIATDATGTDAPISQITTEAQNDPVKAASATPPTPRPAPTVMVADDTGVKILQSAAPIQGVSIDAITYDPDGAVFASGRGTAGAIVRLYLSNEALMDTPVGAEGQWRAEMDVKAGIYSLRADMVDEAGKVLNRVEIPFKREDVSVLAGLAERATQDAKPERDQADSAQEPKQGTATQSTVDAASSSTDGEGEEAPQGGPQPRITSVTVQPGNTLWGIASATYGDGFLFARVFNANVAQIRDPDLIYPGQVFVLPKE